MFGKWNGKAMGPRRDGELVITVFSFGFFEVATALAFSFPCTTS